MERTLGDSKQNIDWLSLTTAVRERLKCGRDRIADGPLPSAAKWWPEPNDFQLELLSELGVSDGLEELVQEWSEEVLAIQTLLDGLVPNEKPPEDESRSAYRMDRSIALRSRAMAVWDEVGVAVRWREGLVHHVRSPRDLLGAPTVRVLSAQEYGEAVTARLQDEIERSAALRMRLHLWQLAVVVLGLVTFFLA